MPQIKQLGRVMVPVADQDTAIAFYTEKLGFSLTADVPFGEGRPLGRGRASRRRRRDRARAAHGRLPGRQDDRHRARLDGPEGGSRRADRSRASTSTRS